MKKKSILIKTISLIAALAVVFAVSSSAAVFAQNESEEFTKTPFEFVSDINVGINIGNTYDVAECWGGPTGWGNPDVTEDLIKSIKAKGFNAIRLPVTWYGRDGIASAPDYKISSNWMNSVKRIVDWVMDNDMYLIINMHHENAWLGTLTDIESDENKALFEKHLDQYKAGWTQIANTFKDYGEKLIFEAHNEVRNGDSWSGYWEGYQQIRIYNQTFVDTVRATGGNNAKRYLVFKSFAGGLMGDYQFYYDEKNGLEPTYNPIPNDPANHLIYSFHSYSPGLFCMNQKNQNASTNVTVFDRESFIESAEKTAQRVQKMFMERGIAVIIGEMGCINKDNIDQRLTHAQTYIDTYSKYGIKCFWWDNGDSKVNNGGSDTSEPFGLVDRRNPSNWAFGNIADVLVNTGSKYLGMEYQPTYTIPTTEVTTTTKVITTTEVPTTTKTPTTAASTTVPTTKSTTVSTTEPTTEKPIVYGDLNGDGKINLLDLISMRKYLAKWNINIDISAADCNRDEKINLLDLILLRKYLAKWNVVLGVSNAPKVGY